MKATDWAWLAGIVDGEGTVGAYFQGRKRGRRAITPILQVVSTDEIIVNKVAQIVRTLGIQVEPTQVGVTKRNRPVWIWACRRAKALQQVLPALLPFLVLKAPQAERLLEIVSGGPYWKGTPGWALEKAEEIRALNQRANAEPDLVGAR